MKTFVFISLVLLSFRLSAQVSEGDKKKVYALVGEEFIEKKNEEYYPFNAICEGCKLDSVGLDSFMYTGLHYNNQFVLYQSPITFMKDKEVLKLLSPNEVTIGEYDAFQSYIRDSMALSNLYFNSENQEESDKYIILTKEQRKARRKPLGYEYKEELEYIDYDSSVYFYVPSYLNWEAKIDYNDYKIQASIAEMYVCQPERINKKRVFDKRKFNYFFTENFEQYELMTDEEKASFLPLSTRCLSSPNFIFNVPTFRDEFVWSALSTHNFDERSVISRIGSRMLKDQALCGIKGFQANAFCHWKSVELQKQFDEKKLNYKVVVTLPTKDDYELESSTFKVPKRNYTKQWEITGKEYGEFMNAVHDSILREQLFFGIESDKDAHKYVEYSQAYLDFLDSNWPNYEGVDRDIVRDIFNLNYSKKINFKDPEVAEIVKRFKDSLGVDPVEFRYQYFNSLVLGAPGIYTPNVLRRTTFDNILRLINPESGEVHVGKTWLLGYENCAGISTQVYAPRNLEKAIERKHQDISLTVPLSKNDDLAKSISYEQALAYYHWKFPIDKANSESDWQDFVYPSKEQFFAVQGGEKIVVEAHELDSPAPAFRYVVHLFPK